MSILSKYIALIFHIAETNNVSLDQAIDDFVESIKEGEPSFEGADFWAGVEPDYKALQNDLDTIMAELEEFKDTVSLNNSTLCDLYAEMEFDDMPAVLA